MNGDPQLKHIPPFPLESDYERDMHQMLYEEEQAYQRWEDLQEVRINNPYGQEKE